MNLALKVIYCYFTEILFFPKMTTFTKFGFLKWSDKPIDVLGIKQNCKCHRISCKRADLDILIEENHLRSECVPKKQTLYKNTKGEEKYIFKTLYFIEFFLTFSLAVSTVCSVQVWNDNRNIPVIKFF